LGIGTVGITTAIALTTIDGMAITDRITIDDTAITDRITDPMPITVRITDPTIATGMAIPTTIGPTTTVRALASGLPSEPKDGCRMRSRFHRFLGNPRRIA